MNILLNSTVYNFNFYITILIFSVINFFLFEFYKNFCSSFKFLDIPNKRSSHTIATPKGAGIVFAITSIIFIIFIFNYSYILILIPLLIIGFLDDFKGVSRISRLFVQFFTSLFIVYNSNLFKFFTLSNGNLENLFFFIFLITCSIGIINFFNFSDGIDGLVASSGSIYLILIGIFTNPIYLFIGVSLGVFLIFNWSPAKLFMGDVGSTFIGAIVVISSLSKNNSLDSLVSLLMIAPILIDPFICVLRRLISRQNIFIAHKTHLYQRLHQSGWKHSYISLLYSAGTLLLSLSFIFFGISFGLVAFLVVFLIGIYLDFNHAVPFIRN